MIYYTKSILLTSDKCWGNPLKNAEIDVAWKKTKKNIELNKGKRGVEKQLREESKKAHIAMKDSKRVFDLQWSVESCVVSGERLHSAIKTKAPIVVGSYTGCFVVPHHHNVKVEFSIVF